MNAPPTRHHLEQTVFAATVLLLAGLLLAAIPSTSDAGDRARVRVGTPRPAAHVVMKKPVTRVVVVKPAPPVVVSPARTLVIAKPRVLVSTNDRAIARRIALHTAAGTDEIVVLRARGWSWTRIGRQLGLDARVVRACVR